MVIKKIGKGWYVVHHRTKGLIGKPIKSSPKGGFKTYKLALKQHRAIAWRKKDENISKVT
jgi:hypothetical protein